MKQLSTIIINALLIAVLTSPTEQLQAPTGPAVPVGVIISSCHRGYVPPLPHLPGSVEGKTVISEAGAKSNLAQHEDTEIPFLQIIMSSLTCMMNYMG